MNRREFEAVLLWKVSRLGRSVAHLYRLLELFELRGIKLISMTEGFDLSTPAGRLVFNILGAVAEMERETIRENVRAGVAAYRAKHGRWGRSRRLIPENICRKAFQDRMRGASWARLEVRYRIPARTLGRAFRGLAKSLPRVQSKKADRKSVV